ncbi:hypothetical protein [Actinacidiphila soli]|uniref:hypothetical protein n=1 Tax=Actinacidiphila soli TaxID=2487275 RepID=UPI000FC9F37F|nr:hypothetical protein [Actinacidiphila soli]
MALNLVHYQHEARTHSALCGRCNSAEGGGFGDAPDLQPHLHVHREIPPADEQQTAPPSCGPPRGTAGRAGGVVDQADVGEHAQLHLVLDGLRPRLADREASSAAVVPSLAWRATNSFALARHQRPAPDHLFRRPPLPHVPALSPHPTGSPDRLNDPAATEQRAP